MKNSDQYHAILQQWHVTAVDDLQHNDWWATAKHLAMREYQLALDKLEGLVVGRLFELTKLNQSGTGEVHNLIDIS